MRLSAGLLLLPVLAGGCAWAGGNQSTANATATVTITRPIRLTKTMDLYFGALLVEPGTNGRLIKQYAAIGGGTRAADPTGVTQIALGAEHWHNAQFEIQGEPNANFSVTLPKGPIHISNSSSGPGLSLRLDVPKFNCYMENALGSDGKSTMWIGGQLNLPRNPTYGYYHAQFPVTVSYN